MKKKRIVFLISCLTGGGAERVTANLANFCFDKKNDVTIITMSDVKDTYSLNNGIKRVFLLKNKERRNKIKDNVLRYKRLKEFVRSNQDVDCYVVMLPVTIFMLCSLKKYTKAKIIVSERNNPSSYKLYEKLMMRYSQKKCDGLVVQTKTIGKWYNHRNMVVIPNAINEDVIINRNKKERDKRIVTVGRLTKQKNQQMLIKAFSKFVSYFPDYKLEIYGQGPLEGKLRSLVNTLDINDKVVFKGYVNNVNEQIVNSKMFVLSSNFEGMPNALIEAMCLGLPCISTDSDGGGVREIIHNNINGVLIRKNDEKDLTSQMIRIVKDVDFSNGLETCALELRKELKCGIIYNKWYEFIIKQLL